MNSELQTFLEPHWLAAVYVLAGIGLYGGYRGWGGFGRLLYFCLFPVHWALFRFWAWRQRNPDDAGQLDFQVGEFLGASFEIVGGLIMWCVIYIWLLWLSQ
jgi:hypothetical protein